MKNEELKMEKEKVDIKLILILMCLWLKRKMKTWMRLLKFPWQYGKIFSYERE